MAERIPAIRVTDPQSRDTTPQSPPLAQTQFNTSTLENGAQRNAPSKEGKPNNTNGNASHNKLLRSLSNSISTQQTGPTPPLSPTGDGSATQSDSQQSPIDPLSRHILRRTHTPQNALPSLLRPTTSGASGASGTSGTSDDKPPDERADGPNTYSRQSTGRTDTGLSTTPKEKRKGVSFLSRIIDRTKKRDTDDDASSSISEALSDLRPEGMEAQVFSQPANNLGYEPRHAQPPAYIRVRAKYKKERDFDRVFLAQELQGSLSSDNHDKQDDAKSIRSVRSRSGTRPGSRSGAAEGAGTIWAMQFSKDGRYLAAAGHDKVIRVWAVISSPGERREGSIDEDNSDHSEHRDMRLSAPVFRSKPIREFEGHTSTVLDLTWSKNNFLLSSSMDKTVRLWHVSRDECLCTFKHNDFVTSIAFHPLDDRFFLAGSLDAKLRLWSIPDKTVAFWNNLGDMITAVEFTPDGKYAIGGCLNGLCMFYETEGLKYQTQIHVRSAHGKNAKGSKITNIQAIDYPPNTSSGITKLLITSNDSRIRLYNFRDKALEIKFKGNVNNNSQIRASFSDDARYIVCGSEDSKAYIWTMNVEDGEKRHKRPVEFFTASDTITTCVAFAPTKTRQLLGRSGDPMYDICNPPPVTLMSRDEEMAGSRSSSKAPTEDGNSPPTSEFRHRRQEESPAYIARSTHKNGNIIVTADFNGRIKVFRQDCAWAKRSKDNWDTSSVFTKASNLRRTASIATRGSSRSLRSAQGSVKTQAPSERILSWRQGINSAPSIAGSSLRSGKAGRSVSPGKSSSQLSFRSNKTRTRPTSSKASIAGPSLPNGGNASDPVIAKDREETVLPQTEPSSDRNLQRMQSDDMDPLGMHGEQSSLFWKLSKDSAMSYHRQHHSNGSNSAFQQNEMTRPATTGALSPMHPLERNASKVSTLSIERTDNSGSESSDDEFMDALDAPHPQHHHHHHHHAGGEEEAHHYRHRGSNSEVVCRHCSGNSFKAARSKKDGDMRLCCTTCGTPA